MAKIPESFQNATDPSSSGDKDLHRLETLETMPSMGGVLFKGFLLSMLRPKKPSSHTRLEHSGILIQGVVADPLKLDRFRQVCQSPRDNRLLPPVFIQSMFVPLLGRYLTSSMFPLSPMGLIHTRQQITQYGPVKEDAALDLFCGLKAMRNVEKGVELDFGLEVTAQGEKVWKGRSVFLIKTGSTSGPRSGASPSKAGQDPTADTGLPVQYRFSANKHTGRDYAKASGDYNPHHLYPLFAKALGFKTSIAHGMWTMGRTLAALEDEVFSKEKSNIFPLVIDTGFKLPVYLPAPLTLGYAFQSMGQAQEGQKQKDAPDSADLEFEVLNADTRLPHLKGHVQYRAALLHGSSDRVSA